MGTERRRRRLSITNLSHTITGVRGGRLDRRLQLLGWPRLEVGNECLEQRKATHPAADMNENS